MACVMAYAGVCGGVRVGVCDGKSVKVELTCIRY